MTEVAYISFLQFAVALPGQTQADQVAGGLVSGLFGQGVSLTAFEAVMLTLCLGALVALVSNLHMEQRPVTSQTSHMARRWESPYAFPLEMMHGLQASGVNLSLPDLPPRKADQTGFAETGAFLFNGTQLPLFAVDRSADPAPDQWQEAA
jgi:cyanate permease